MKNLKFIHITKTAGTSIEDSAFNQGILWGRFDLEYTKNIKPNWHKPFTLLDPKLKNKYDWFTVVRNPYTRIVSEFYCSWIHPKNKDVSIKDYNSIIRNNILNRTSTKFGFHYYEQYLYIDKSININIIKFENLEEEFSKLMQKYDINIILDKKNIGQHIYSTYEFDSQTIQLINDIYHYDFLEFNYEKVEL